MNNNILNERIIPNSYDEVYGILLALGNSFISKLPKDILRNIANNLTYDKKNGKKVYKIPKYDLNISLNIQGVSKEALSIIYLLYFNYWCTSDKEKKYMRKILKYNEIEEEKQKEKRYNVNNLFQNRNLKENILQNKNVKINNSLDNEMQKEQSIKNSTSELMPTISKKEKWYKKLLNKILNLL